MPDLHPHMPTDPAAFVPTLTGAVEVESLGRCATRGLAGKGGAVVLAVFRRSFYLRAEDGGIFCVGRRSLGDGPMNVLCRSDGRLAGLLATMEPGLSAAISHGRLRVGSVTIDGRGARVWSPPVASMPWDPKMIRAGLEETAAVLATGSDLSGFGPLLPSIITGARYPATPDHLLAMAGPSIDAVRAWLGRADPRDPVPARVFDLVGLGPGLTPSGDDFLGGVMIALHHFGRPAAARALWGAIRQRVRRDTNLISAAHLEQAATGAGHRRVHDFLATLATPGNRGLGTARARLGDMGHSSGWDMMTGMLCVARRMAMS